MTNENQEGFEEGNSELGEFFKDLLKFDRAFTPLIIQIIWVIVLVLHFILFMTGFKWPILFLLAPINLLFARVFLEAVMVLFNINKNLNEINMKDKL